MDRKTLNMPLWLMLFLTPTRWLFESYFKSNRPTAFEGWAATFFIINLAFVLISVPVKQYLESWWLLLVWLLPWSRLIEIIYAFYNDALDKLDKRTVQSVRKPSVRFKLLALSYAELATCFGSLYVACPVGSFHHDFASGFEALYYSWMTITTTGYGDVYPIGRIARLCAMSEVGIGVGLIVFIVGTYFSGDSGKADS